MAALVVTFPQIFRTFDSPGQPDRAFFRQLVTLYLMTKTHTLPPDRSHLSTERRHEASVNLDAMDIQSCVELMADDHRDVARVVKDASPDLALFIEDLVANLRRDGRLIYLGAGTSGRLGVLDAAECPPTFQSDQHQVIGIIAGGDASLRRSSEAMEDDPDGAREQLEDLDLTEHDTVLGIAAGGTTPYVLGAIRIAKEYNATTGLLTCAPQARSPESCDHVILLDTGPELLTGSTRLKAGSATKLALNIITTTAFVRLGKVYSNLMVDLRATNDKLTDRAIRILRELCPELSRETAADGLEHAQGNLKAAIIMQKRVVNFEEAQALILEHHGHLRPILTP